MFCIKKNEWIQKVNGLICKKWIAVSRNKQKGSFKIFRKNIKFLFQNKLVSEGILEHSLERMEKRLRYQIKADFENIKVPIIYDNWHTIKQLIETNKSFIRFGDGEFLLILGQGIPFQKYDAKLANILKEILQTDNTSKGLLTGIPYEYFHEMNTLRPFVKAFCRDWVPDYYNQIVDLMNMEKEYYSTSVSQVYPTYEKYDFELHFSQLKKIWNNKKITLIIGDRVFKKIKSNILDNAAECNIIYGPSSHAFEEYNNLLHQVTQENKENILIFVLGPAGKALAYECFKQGYRVLDLGHTIKDYDTYKNNNDFSTFFLPD